MRGALTQEPPPRQGLSHVGMPIGLSAVADSTMRSDPAMPWAGRKADRGRMQELKPVRRLRSMTAMRLATISLRRSRRTSGRYGAMRWYWSGIPTRQTIWYRRRSPVCWPICEPGARCAISGPTCSPPFTTSSSIRRASATSATITSRSTTSSECWPHRPPGPTAGVPRPAPGVGCVAGATARGFVARGPRRYELHRGCTYP